MKIRCKTRKGGSVTFNTKDGAWASYAVAGVKGLPTPELFYSGIKLPDGRSVQLFVNRETGLIVVDVVDKGGKGGCEVYRRNV
jgi:hypothetical protein